MDSQDRKIKSIEISSDLIGIRNPELLACSIEPQRMGEFRNAFNYFGPKPQWSRPVEKPRHR
jgi:hypothetical protein